MGEYFLAIEKYVNPTRYRQIIETEKDEKLTVEEQVSLSEDQKKLSYLKTDKKLCNLSINENDISTIIRSLDPNKSHG